MRDFRFTASLAQDAFEEAKHPRDHGKFSSGSGSSSPSTEVGRGGKWSVTKSGTKRVSVPDPKAAAAKRNRHEAYQAQGERRRAAKQFTSTASRIDRADKIAERGRRTPTADPLKPVLAERRQVNKIAKQVQKQATKSAVRAMKQGPGLQKVDHVDVGHHEQQAEHHRQQAAHYRDVAQKTKAPADYLKSVNHTKAMRAHQRAAAEKTEALAATAKSASERAK